MTVHRSPSSIVETPAPIHGTTQFDMRSLISGRAYRVFVFKPPLPPPPGGYPAVIVTDANMSFPIAATMAATFALSGQAALAIGVGYPTDDVMELISNRNRDLTPPTPLSGLKSILVAPPPKVEDYGGMGDFYRFLVDELRPVIASMHPVNADDQTLYGHSLGGLFTIGVLLKHPEAFRSFVASSPSLFWNNRSAFAEIPGYDQKLRSTGAAPNILVTVGANEQTVTDLHLPGASLEQMKQMTREWRMVDNAREMASQLRAAGGGPGYSVRFHAFEGEDHLTVLPASISRAFVLALRPAPSRRSWFGLRKAPAVPKTEIEAELPADPNATVDGTWNISMKTPMGARDCVLVLETDGASLVGALRDSENAGDITNGKVDGGRIAWESAITRPMALTLKFSGAVSGDRVAGTVKAGAFAAFPFSGSRA